ncbi:helix-turn-helix domain-containing protein [Flavobacterium sp.]|uniref:helix-turn-helix domain-containing protein n=1 Tax=Flavobacterium sp. TaxID=239 RepID=UPI0038FBFCFA
MLVNQIAEAIRTRRKELDITQSHLSELSDISVNTIYKLERAQSNPSIEIIQKLMDVLGLELNIEVKKVNK